VRADPEVLVAAVVNGCGGATVARVRARAADRVHHALHGVAPAVAAGAQGDAADVAVAVAVAGGGLELVTAWRAHHVPHDALHNIPAD
jgi:hypothetical protein